MDLLVSRILDIGAAPSITRVEVVWTSGTRQTIAAPIKMNARLDVTEPR